VAVATSDQVAPEECTLHPRSLGDRTSLSARWKLTVTLTIAGTYRTVGNFSFSARVEGRDKLLTCAAKKVGGLRRSASDDHDMQKRANRPALTTAAACFAALVHLLLGAGLNLSVGVAGGEVRVAVATSDQVAPEECTLHPRSLGDRT
jgi:hypothetical protein